MKKIYFIILFTIASVVLNAQDCFWAKRAGTASTYDQGNGVTTDVNDNAYVVGSFSSSTIVFSPYTLTNHNPGSNDMFIVKYNKSGVVKWAKNYGTADGNAIASDLNGNVYVTGNYTSTFLKFGTDTVFNANPGSTAIYIVKLDSSGNVIWAKTNVVVGAPGNNYSAVNGIANDDIGGVYITGQFASAYMVFGNDTLYRNSTTGYNIFIAKYDINGNPIWAKGSQGTSYDMGLGIAADANNVFITGRYTSSFMVFGNDTLYGTISYDEAFIVKCNNANGNFLWARSARGTASYGYGIAADGFGNAYITGEQAGGPPLIFGNDTLANSAYGDLFLVKYDANGNALWARETTNSYGGNKAFGIASDGIGNIYITGILGAKDTTRFGNVALINPSYFQNTYPLFVVKYDSAGNALSGICSMSTPSVTGGGRGIGIAVDNSGKIFVTGYFVGTIKLGSSSVVSAGGYDFLLFHTYPFSVSASATTINCYGSNNAVATANLIGGRAPFSYLWMPSGQTTQVATNLSGGIDSLKVTDANGCIQKDIFTIVQPSYIPTNICMVTVDSTSQHNIIVWDKTAFTNVDSFIVYREITTNNYQRINAQAYSDLSEFVDTVRTQYFPNTGDPNAGTYRYKLQMLDTCGNFSQLSPYHNTIYILNSNGTFFWNQLYTIENGANPVSSYVLLRDDNSTGNWHAISSVAGTQQLVSDPLYNIYQNTASWRVQTIWSITCTPTMKTQSGTMNNFSTSYSNIYSNSPTAIKNNSAESKLNVYPNPSSGKITLEYAQLGKNQKASVEIYNVIGKKVYSQNELQAGQSLIDISAQPSGVYYLNLKTADKVITKKIVIE